MPLNMEFKARVADLDGARNWLISRRARFIGIDEQRDVYFRVPEGRLKLRMGNIERALIYYRRAEENDIKRSDVWLYPVQDGDALEQLLALSLGILADVSKRREIYFIGPAKFHLDHVMGLGYFVEVEVIDQASTADVQELEKLATYYLEELHIAREQLVRASYLDLLLAINNR